MPWDQSRQMPWKRLFVFEAIYIALFALIMLFGNTDDWASALTGLGMAIVLTTVLMYVLVKFGYELPWLKSRAELAATRAQRLAERQAIKAAKSGKPVPVERYRPAPTRRTSSGPTNRQRRTRSTRKR